MSALARISAVEHIGARWLQITFSDGLHGDHEAPAAMRPRLLREYRLERTG